MNDIKLAVFGVLRDKMNNFFVIKALVVIFLNKKLVLSSKKSTHMI